MSLQTDPVSFFRKDSKEFARFRDGHEYRPEQEHLAKAIQNTIRNKQVLLAEAGTGVGKTLAYLLPILSHSLQTGDRVVVSTETRSLQSQIKDSEIPLVEKLLETGIRTEICLGSSNYLCKRKYNRSMEEGKMDAAMGKKIGEFSRWVEEDPLGILFQYRGFLSSDFRSKVARDSLDCAGSRCQFFHECFYFQARERWKSATLLIVNHSLLSLHYILDRGLLPEFSIAVMDEAHRFPEIFLGASRERFSFQEMNHLLRQIEGSGKAQELLTGYQIDFVNLHPLFTGQTVRIKEGIWTPSGEEFLGEINHLKEKLLEETRMADDVWDEGDYSGEPVDEETLRKSANLRRLSDTISLLQRLFEGPSSDRVHWITGPREDGKLDYHIHAGDLESGTKIKNTLFSGEEPLIFLSATLTTPGPEPFGYFARELGAMAASRNRIRSIQLQSPFPYAKNALLFLPGGFPDPTGDEHGFQRATSVALADLYDLCRGGMFALFTSIRSLNDAREKLLRMRPDLKNHIHSQVELGPARALEGFKGDEKGILFGLSTFWQGIDIPGDALRMVVLVRIPFRPPGDPVMDARIEKEKAQGRNPFSTLQLPLAVIAIKQGFGRLIRSGKDRGAVAILDPRMTGRSYGRTILDSLPPARRIQRIDELAGLYTRLFSQEKNLPE